MNGKIELRSLVEMSTRRARGGAGGKAMAWMGAIGLGTFLASSFVNNRSKANVKHFEESSTALPHERDWVNE